MGASLHKQLKRLEQLEPRRLLAGTPSITEFVARNQASLADGFGNSPDWIEIYNPTDSSIDLQGWYLTDRADDLDRWQFPLLTIEAGEFLVVFASGENTVDDLGHPHTNFALAGGGEYLALVHPDGRTVVSQFAPAYPEQWTDISFGLRMQNGDPASIIDSDVGYFNLPTPGAVNASLFSIGPLINEVNHTPLSPSIDDPVAVTARIEQTLDDVARATLVFRVMYGEEISVAMRDDGVGPDQTAGDKIFAAEIPAGVAEAGQMLRYAVSAEDLIGNGMRSPRIVDTTGNDQSPHYYGTVIESDASAGLPVFHWFSEDVSAARQRSGARVTAYYQGQLYDNIFARQRGAFTNGSSQKFFFNDGQHFFVNEKLGHVAEININAEGDDNSFVRQTLAMEANEWAGVPASESFLMPMNVNGRFDRVGIFLEQIDENFLARHKFDTDGALYKFVQRENHISSGPALGDTVTGVEKKLGMAGDFSDLESLVDGLAIESEDERRRFLFDNVNLPNVINYLAVRAVTSEADDTAKNFYLHRDSTTGEWSIFPWDKDRTFGLPEEPVTRDKFFANPFSGSGGNRLYGAIFSDPFARDMYLRRLRTVMDEILQPPGTPAEDRVFEKRIDEIFASVSAILPPSADDEVKRLKEYFDVQRVSLYEKHSIDRVTDFDSIFAMVPEFVDEIRYIVPTDNSLGTTWTKIDALNIDQWQTGQTGIGYERSPNDYVDLIKTTVIPSDACATCASVLLRIPFHLDDTTTIDDLTLRMKYDDGFVAYLNGVEVARRNVEGEAAFDSRAKGHLNSQAVHFENILISEHIPLLNSGENVLAIHGVNLNPTNSDMLILPELVSGKFGDDNAAGIPHSQSASPEIRFGVFETNPATGNLDEEFVSLNNAEGTAVDITGWKLAGAVQHVFAAGTIIPANGTLFVSPNASAFRNRSVAPTGNMTLLVEDGYQGNLTNENSVELTTVDGTEIDRRRTQIPVPGDANRDGRIDAGDADLICSAVRTGDPQFDLTGDNVTSYEDLKFLVHDLLNSQIGDANLDGTFDSADLVQVFQVNQFEDAFDGNSTWSGGDWNCDGEFSSTDLVAAFQAGGYTASALSSRFTGFAAALDEPRRNAGQRRLDIAANLTTRAA